MPVLDKSKNNLCPGLGRGVVTSTKRTIFGNMASQSTCSECEGYGVTIEHKCSDCKGSGIKIKKEEIDIPVPEAVENGTQFTMRGYGEVASRGEAGDLYVVVRVKKPKNLSKKARELLEELKKEGY
jgi:molecular chaperone DnaJ